MSNLDTNHLLISVILFLLIAMVYMSTKQSMCNIKENFYQSQRYSDWHRSNVSTDNLNIEDGYDAKTNLNDEFLKNSQVEPTIISKDDVTGNVYDGNAKLDNGDKTTEFNNTGTDLEVDSSKESDYLVKDYKNDYDFTMSDGNVYSKPQKEYIDPKLRTNNLGILQSNEDIYERVNNMVPEVEGVEQEPKIIEDPDLGKNKVCVNDADREFDPSAYDPYDENAYSIIDIKVPETKEYRPKKLDKHANVNVEIKSVEHDHDHANFSHDDDIIDKQKCNVIKKTMDQLNNENELNNDVKDSWNKNFKSTCGEWKN